MNKDAKWDGLAQSKRLWRGNSSYAKSEKLQVEQKIQKNHSDFPQFSLWNRF